MSIIYACLKKYNFRVDNSRFMHQTVRVCHTDHTDSIISSMACIFDFKFLPYQDCRSEYFVIFQCIYFFVHRSFNWKE